MPDPRALDTGWSLRKAATIVMAVGIRPCSGAIFILIFALTQGLYWAGILSTFAMALGTAITVSALAIGAVLFRSVTLRYASSRWTSALYDITAIAGKGIGIFVDDHENGGKRRSTNADYMVRNPDEVEQLLRALAGLDTG